MHVGILDGHILLLLSYNALLDVFSFVALLIQCMNWTCIPDPLAEKTAIV
jgi:hypothetical protein